MNTGDRRRPRRVAEMVQSHLAEALRREIDDPRLTALVITGVEVPDDLSVAHVQVRLLVGGDDQASRHAALKSLSRASARLRRGLGPTLGLRRVPALSFTYDEGLDKRRRIEELLEEIEREPKAKTTTEPTVPSWEWVGGLRERARSPTPPSRAQACCTTPMPHAVTVPIPRKPRSSLTSVMRSITWS